jgi:5-methylcytosine-specific restriction endonuclease McrA
MRAVPEWRAASDDAKVPKTVRLRVFERCGGVCHISRRKIRPGEAWELEHVKPLSMGGEHRELNLAPALVQPHREKTAREAGERAKADRIRAKHLGTWEKSSRPLPSRKFRTSRKVGG